MISLPSKPKITKKEENKAIFEIEGLYPGYGMTIGNSLRRVLFSSLEGAAITQLKIEGCHHEFSAIEGVLEDVITIILNIKKLRFKIYSDGPEKVFLKIKGEKKVKGSDLEIPSQVELINKDSHIVTLTDKKSELNMELLIERGLGYVVSDQEKREKLEVGQISVDAIFTPIKNVNFRVENMRVGKRTDFDRLFLEIETDGTINPEEAFKKSSKILVDHFQLLLGKEESVKKENKDIEVKEIERPAKEEKTEVEKMKIEDIGISSRIANILEKNNIKTVSKIVKKGRKGIIKIDGMGDGGIKEITKKLKKINVEF